MEERTLRLSALALLILGLGFVGSVSPGQVSANPAQACQTWAKTFGGSGWDEGSSVQQTDDGGYILLGATRSYGAGGFDTWLIKTDANGNKLWERTFGGSGDDEGYSVQQTDDGGYILLGVTKSYGAGGRDFWLIKYCPRGT
ncbi:hypothetical protein H5T55_00240 [Candidatus Bipolaricaulota bacterium]|nr:hypothetical protein [Candidatus Bipolaricaulota bacterium]